VSPTFTIWKRIFVEHDYTFKQGFFLFANASAGSSTVQVAKLSTSSGYVRIDGLSPGNRVAIFDVTHSYDTPHDVACIGSIQDTPANAFITLALTDCTGNPHALSFD